jgi:hypothetical protein
VMMALTRPAHRGGLTHTRALGGGVPSTVCPLPAGARTKLRAALGPEQSRAHAAIHLFPVLSLQLALVALFAPFAARLRPDRAALARP